MQSEEDAMTTLDRCIDMLERYRVPYVHTTHSNAYCAAQAAQAEYVPARMFAKTVIVQTPTGYAMAVLPGDCKINFDSMDGALGCRCRLATEEEVRALFPESEVGAMPPFGPSFRMPVYMDIRLFEEPYIVFNAGTHRDAIHISVGDYVRLTNPVIVRIAYPIAMIRQTEGASHAGI
jgi:Ala-tRNA(Pro) deacylase